MNNGTRISELIFEIVMWEGGMGGGSYVLHASVVDGCWIVDLTSSREQSCVSIMVISDGLTETF